jgi:hypothetical protein
MNNREQQVLRGERQEAPDGIFNSEKFRIADNQAANEKAG